MTHPNNVIGASPAEFSPPAPCIEDSPTAKVEKDVCLSNDTGIFAPSDQTASPTEEHLPGGNIPTAIALPEALRFDLMLRELHPHAPVTLLLVALIVISFLLQAFEAGHCLEIRSNHLLASGAVYGPLSLGREKWRLISGNFLHSGLEHLVGNLCALLFVGAMVERLVGSRVFLAVYLFAGVGGALLSVAWFPTTIQVGASGAIFGVYGLLLGCFVSGFRTIPWQILGLHVGILLVLGCFMLIHQYLVRQENLVAHLGGALCGFAAGLILGPSHRLLKRGRTWIRPACFVLVAGGMTWALFTLANWGARKPLERMTPYTQAIPLERDLLVKFDAALEHWLNGAMTDEALADLLEKILIPEWNAMRQRCHLIPPDNTLPNDLLSQFRAEPLPRPSRAAKRTPLNAEELKELFMVYASIRAESWTNLLHSLRSQNLTVTTLTDLLFVEIMRGGLDEAINEDNPLHEWISFSPEKSRDQKLEPKRPGKAK